MSSRTDGKREMLDGNTALTKFEVEDKSNVVMSELQSGDWLPTQQALEKPKQMSLGNESGLNLVEFKSEYINTSSSQRISPLNLQLKNESISCGIEVKPEDLCEINESTKNLRKFMPSQSICSEISHETDEFDSKEIKMEIVDETLMQQDEKIGSHSPPNQNQNNHNSTAELYKGHVLKSELVIGPETLQLPSEGSDPHTGSTPRKEKTTVTESLSMPKLKGVCEKKSGKESFINMLTKQTEEISHQFNVYQKTFARKCGPQMLIQAENKPHKCYVCKRTFSQSHHLREHILTHTGEKPYKCDVCNKTFRHKSNLRTHMFTHTGARPYKCDVCHRTFRQKSNLRSHLFVHTGEKPHKCDVCNRTFSQTHNLRTHMLTHAAVKPHKCDICQKSYTVKRSLRKHLFTHSGDMNHKCDVCQKTFTLKNLQKHILTHTDDSRHRCSVCQKPFTLKSNLQKHFLIHTGYIPNKCFVCKKVFTTKSGLEAHMVIHTYRKKISQV